MDTSLGRSIASTVPPRTTRTDGPIPVSGLGPVAGLTLSRPEPLDEIWKLRGCISDLVSLMALPTLWRDGDAAMVSGVLADVLLRMMKLDFVYVRLNAPPGAAPVELLRVAHDPNAASAENPMPADAAQHAATRAAQAGRLLAPWLTPEVPSFGARVPNPLGGGEATLAFLWLGPDMHGGVVAAGSQRDGFPTYAETLQLRVAVNQAVVELQQAEVASHRRHSAELERMADRLQAENVWLRRAQERGAQADPIIGQSEAMRRVRLQIEQAAPGSACVLIEGEPGTGKALVARSIHQHSGRRDKPFVRLDCAGLPAAQMEAELFGQAHAVLGAGMGGGQGTAVARHLGAVELAQGGTLFLDGIGDLPMDLQTRLLRLLQEHEFVPQGGTRAIRADVRLVAACSGDLAGRVAAHEFRAELFERLRRDTILLPPVRARAEDIPLLVRHFAQQHARRSRKLVTSIAPATMEALCAYAWPGNVREIDNLIERGVMLSPGSSLQVPLGGMEAVRAAAAVPQGHGNAPLATLEEAQREHILRALAASNWVIAGAGGAAAKLGMKRTSLQYRMQKLGITRPV
jgi:transcriptional regulator with GAF, ATPase, and Fis domain